MLNLVKKTCMDNIYYENLFLNDPEHAERIRLTSSLKRQANESHIIGGTRVGGIGTGLMIVFIQLLS